MLTLSEKEILRRIAAGDQFEAKLPNGSLEIRIREHVPYLCVAPHAGHALWPELEKKCRVGAADRQRAGAPYTDDLLDAFPLTLVVRDSRFAYDLDLPPETCVRDTAGDTPLWRRPLTPRQKKVALGRHALFYRILTALADALTRRFGGLLIVGLYSGAGIPVAGQPAPVFNIGVGQLDHRRSGRLVAILEKGLSESQLPNLISTVGRDTTDSGRSYLAKFARTRLSKTQVIPVRVLKIFLDKETMEPFPLVIEGLQQGLHQAVLDAATHFGHGLDRTELRRADLVLQDLEPAVLKADRALYRLARGVETLQYVNPVNLQQEKKRFLSRVDYTPQFRYRQLRIDPYDFREKLYKLPVSQIQDPLLRGLYRSVVDSFATKIDMLTQVGTPQFQYTSLRYYGEPSPTDIANARFLLHAKNLPKEMAEPRDITAEQAKEAFERAAADFGLSCKVALSTRIVAKAMVNGGRRTLLVNRNAMLTKTELSALIHHELGVHMVTSVNAAGQPLRILSLGLPGNTYTQEGLAILNEYLSGNLTLTRLKTLALRVLAVDMMVKGAPFGRVFKRFRGEFELTSDDAFGLTVRVFRGGGFTKDYLYLRGFRDLLAVFAKRPVLSLFTGKTSLAYQDAIEELLEREVLVPPLHRPDSLSPPPPSAVLDYLVGAVR